MTTPTPAPTAALLQAEIGLLKAQRDYLLTVMTGIAEMLSNHPEVDRGSTRVHFAHYNALNALRAVHTEAEK